MKYRATPKLIWFWLKSQGTAEMPRLTIAGELGLATNTIRTNLATLMKRGYVQELSPRTHLPGKVGATARVLVAVGDYTVLPLPRLPDDVKKLTPAAKLVWLYLANATALGIMGYQQRDVAKELGLSELLVSFAFKQLRRINAI